MVKKRLKDLYTKQVEKEFADIFMKLKKGTLSKEEKLGPSLPPTLEVDLSIVE